MNRLITLSIILCLSATSYAQDWQTVKFPSKANLTGVQFISPDTGFITTSSGQLYRTFDQGKSWDEQIVQPGLSLEDLDFINGNTGFVCGREGAIFVTHDAGYSWQDHSLSDSLPWFFEIEMVDEKHGLVVGASREPDRPLNGLAMSTSDGGKTWERLQPMGSGYAEIVNVSGGPLYFLSFGNISVSNDKGKTWTKRMTHNGNPARTLSIFGKTAIIAGPHGLIQWSMDSALTWNPTPQVQEKLYIASVLINEKVGYVAGARTPIMKTSDGGKTWEPETATSNYQISAMCTINGKVWAVGSGGLVLTNDTN